MTIEKEWWRKVLIFSPHSDDEDAIRLQTFLKAINKKFTGFDTKVLDVVAGPVRGFPNKVTFKHMLEKMGYKDNCMEAEPVFERRKNGA